MTPSLTTLAFLLSLAGCGSSDRASNAPLPPLGEAPGAGGSGSDLWVGSSRQVMPLSADAFEAALHGRVAAAPDRALIRVGARAGGTDRGGASRAASALGTALLGELAEAGKCSASLVDRTVVRFHDAQEWRSEVSLRVDAILTGLADVNSRAERLEHCLARIDSAANSREEGAISMGPPLLTLDHPEAHRVALLARAFEDMRGAAEATDSPAQYQAAATHCTSNGRVSIQERSLGGIALQVDFHCQPVFETPAPVREPAQEGSAIL